MERTWFTPVWGERMKWIRPAFFATWAACMGIATHTSENSISDYLSISAIGLLISYGWLWMPVYLNTFFKGHGSATVTFNRVIIVGVFMLLAIVVSMRIETLIVAFSAATAASHFLLKHKKEYGQYWTGSTSKKSNIAEKRIKNTLSPLIFPPHWR